MRPPKFNFIPERLLKEPAKDSTYRVSIYSQGTLVFPKDVVSIYELDGKYIRFYVDKEKRTVGWTLFENYEPSDNLEDARQLKANPNGPIVVGIKKLLTLMGVDYTEGFKGLEVGTYKTSLIENQVYYITLPEKEVTIKTNEQA